MAEEKKTYEDMSNPEKIDAKKRKIKKLFRDLPTEKKQFAEGLINQFAVTSVTLERLADAINNGDLIEDFGAIHSASSRMSWNTTQHGNRSRIAIRLRFYPTRYRLSHVTGPL